MKISLSKAAFTVEAQIVTLGKDFVIILSGGQSHLGAAAVSQTHKNINRPERDSVTTSLITLLGHKEDLIVQKYASSLSRRFNTNFAVVAGMHWDNLSEDELGIVMLLLDDLLTAVIDQISAMPDKS